MLPNHGIKYPKNSNDLIYWWVTDASIPDDEILDELNLSSSDCASKESYTSTPVIRRVNKRCLVTLRLTIYHTEGR